MRPGQNGMAMGELGGCLAGRLVRLRLVGLGVTVGCTSITNLEVLEEKNSHTDYIIKVDN